MTELGYFALGFVSGCVFMLASLISVGRWLKRISGDDYAPPAQQQPTRKTKNTMWD